VEREGPTPAGTCVPSIAAPPLGTTLGKLKVAIGLFLWLSRIHASTKSSLFRLPMGYAALFSSNGGSLSSSSATNRFRYSGCRLKFAKDLYRIARCMRATYDEGDGFGNHLWEC
jgi:hypothetical protein